MNKEIALLAALIVLTHAAGAAAGPDWDAAVTGQELRMPPAQTAPQPKPKTEKIKESRSAGRRGLRPRARIEPRGLRQICKRSVPIISVQHHPLEATHKQIR